MIFEILGCPEFDTHAGDRRTSSACSWTRSAFHLLPAAHLTFRELRLFDFAVGVLLFAAPFRRSTGWGEVTL
jgi:hypothetical protein